MIQSFTQIRKAFETKGTLKKGSINVYMSLFKRLCTGLGYAHDPCDLSKFEDVDKTIAYIRSDAVLLNNKTTFLNVLVQVLRNTNEHHQLSMVYGKLFQTLIHDVKPLLIVAPPSESLLAKHKEFPMEKLIELRDEMLASMRKYRSRASAVKSIVMCLNTYNIPALRGEDYVHCRYSDTHIPEDHINLKLKYMYLNSGKTQGKFGERMIPLPDHLCAILIECKEILKTDWLIPYVGIGKHGDAPMDPSSYSHFARRLGCGSQYMRQLDNMHMAQTATMGERLEHAKQTGHSFLTAMTSYQKLNKILYPNKVLVNLEKKSLLDMVINMVYAQVRRMWSTST